MPVPTFKSAPGYLAFREGRHEAQVRFLTTSGPAPRGYWEVSLWRVHLGTPDFVMDSQEFDSIVDAETWGILLVRQTNEFFEKHTRSDDHADHERA